MTGIMRRSGLATVLLASGLVLAGCSDEEPQPPPKTSGNSPTAVTTSAAPVAAPTLPTAATADPEGAEAFVRYFWDVFNYTYASGDTQLLRSISDKSCKFCADVAGDVDRLTREGGRTEGSRITVREAIAPPERATDGLIVSSVVSQSAGRTLAADGSVLSQGASMPNSLAKVLVIYGTQWRVVGVEVEERGMQT
jgi:hypothetical protein